MKKLRYLFIGLILCVSFKSFAQETRELKIEFKPKQYDLRNKARFTDEIDGLYKYWKYVAFVEYSNLNTEVENFSVQFYQKNFESEKHYSKGIKQEINWYMPSSNVFYVIGEVFNKKSKEVIQRDTIKLEAKDHIKLKNGNCDNTFVEGNKIDDSVKWRFCANKDQFSYVGNQIEDFTFTSIDDKQYKLSDFKNKIVFINAWFVGCAPCIGELPLLKKLSEKYKNNSDVVFITYVNTNKEKVLSKKKLFGDSYDNYIMVTNDNFKLSDYFGMTGFPTNYILDGNRRFRFMTNGYPLENGMKYKDYKAGFINEKVYNGYIEIIDKLLSQ